MKCSFELISFHIQSPNISRLFFVFFCVFLKKGVKWNKEKKQYFIICSDFENSFLSISKLIVIIIRKITNKIIIFTPNKNDRQYQMQVLAMCLHSIFCCFLNSIFRKRTRFENLQKESILRKRHLRWVCEQPALDLHLPTRNETLSMPNVIFRFELNWNKNSKHKNPRDTIEIGVGVSADDKDAWFVDRGYLQSVVE